MGPAAFLLDPADQRFQPVAMPARDAGDEALPGKAAGDGATG
jgi:hypothetical protein